MADGGGRSARLAAFLGSPIPKDPALAAYERQVTALTGILEGRGANYDNSRWNCKVSASFSDADMEEEADGSATSSDDQRKEQSEEEKEGPGEGVAMLGMKGKG